jgi:uncharacterized membrane protein
VSYQEKRSIYNFVGTLLISGVYSWYMWQQRPMADPYAPEVFVFWGKFFVLLLIITTFIHIVISIVAGLFQGVATSISKRPQDATITDERDDMVDLKASRIALYTFAAGVMLAMALLWAGQTPTVMFVTLFLSGMISSLVGNVAEFLYYRGGVDFG